MTFMRKILDVLRLKNNTDIIEDENIALISNQEISNIDSHLLEEQTKTKQQTDEIFIQSNVDKKENDNAIIAEEVVYKLQTEQINNNGISDNFDFQDECIDTEDIPYKSKRLIIKGLHMYFIDIARDIISSNGIKKIPLMREYNISSETLDEIIIELQTAGILDRDKQLIMNSEEFELFIDIYEPSIFECKNTVFDKDIFMCMGEIIFDDGIEKIYDSLQPDEVIDYLNIMEKLDIIVYDACKNSFDILISKDKFYDICKCIPNTFSSLDFKSQDISFDNIDYDNLSGLEFEKYCAYILSKNGYENIKITPSSGDHGIDILAEKDDITYAIQCKCYSSNIGNAAVQQAHTGKSLYHRDVAVVMTNQYFTQQAKEEAAQLGVKLWDRDKLDNLIEQTK